MLQKGLGYLLPFDDPFQRDLGKGVVGAGWGTGQWHKVSPRLGLEQRKGWGKRNISSNPT